MAGRHGNEIYLKGITPGKFEDMPFMENGTTPLDII